MDRHSPLQVVQIIIGTVFCAVYMLLQMQADPYHDVADDFLANACSFSLLVVFVCMLLFQVATLTEMDELQQRMSDEQKHDFEVPMFGLSVFLLVSVLGAIGLSFGLLTAQVVRERAQQQREKRAARARRLCWVASSKEVVLGSPVVGAAAPPTHKVTHQATFTVPTHFHLFLSHVWGTGQDQMRIVKQRLLEMVPELEVFLDVDGMRESDKRDGLASLLRPYVMLIPADLEEIGDLEGYINRSEVILVYCSQGYCSCTGIQPAPPNEACCTDSCSNTVAQSDRRIACESSSRPRRWTSLSSHSSTWMHRVEE